MAATIRPGHFSAETDDTIRRAHSWGEMENITQKDASWAEMACTISKDHSSVGTAGIIWRGRFSVVTGTTTHKVRSSVPTENMWSRRAQEKRNVGINLALTVDLCRGNNPLLRYLAKSNRADQEASATTLRVSDSRRHLKFGPSVIPVFSDRNRGYASEKVFENLVFEGWQSTN